MSERRITWLSVGVAAMLMAISPITYKLSHLLAQHIGLVTYISKWPAIDDRIPLLPVFVLIYLLSFAFWPICIIVNSKVNVERYTDFIVGFLAAYGLSFVWMSLFPAVMDRAAEGLPEALGSDIFSTAQRWLITVLDPGDMAPGLLPSMHCMQSAFCYFGVMRCREVPRAWRIFVLIYATAILASTLFTKQHYVPDVIAGVAVAALFWGLSRRFHWGQCIRPMVEKLEGKGRETL